MNEENEDMILSKIALTEIVHCKSHSDKEISRICKAHCVQKWLEKILSLFNGKYIVIVGGKAKAYEKLIKTIANDKKVIISNYPLFQRKESLRDNILKQL